MLRRGLPQRAASSSEPGVPRPGQGARELGRRLLGVPDFNAELLSSAITDEGAEIGEWRWRGTHTDGSTFAMRGVTIMGVTDDRIAWGRLYMEVVEEGGADIDEMVRETYRPAIE